MLLYQMVKDHLQRYAVQWIFRLRKAHAAKLHIGNLSAKVMETTKNEKPPVILSDSSFGVFLSTCVPVRYSTIIVPDYRFPELERQSQELPVRQVRQDSPILQ